MLLCTYDDRSIQFNNYNQGIITGRKEILVHIIVQMDKKFWRYFKIHNTEHLLSHNWAHTQSRCLSFQYSWHQIPIASRWGLLGIFWQNWNILGQNWAGKIWYFMPYRWEIKKELSHFMLGKTDSSSIEKVLPCVYQEELRLTPHL